MASVQELVAVGERVGLEGNDLAEFVKEQQAIAREERLKDKEEREKERAEVEKDRAERDKDREFQLKKLELEIKKMESTYNVEGSVHGNDDDDDDDDDDENGGDANADGENVETRRKLHPRTAVKGPKMPPFDEKDDMDSYLHRFERYAVLQGWNKGVWAIYLAALLKGKALDVYARLTPDQARDYSVLKSALLKRYELTDEGYKQRFYEAKADKGESPQQFITRLKSYFMRWIELAKVEKSFDGLLSLMVRERYLATCSKPLELFLRERAVIGLEEIAKLAEQYEDAHGSKGVQKKEVNSLEQKGSSAGVSTSANDNSAGSSQNTRKCFTCGKRGHIAKNCFKRVHAGGMRPNMQMSGQNRQWRPRPNYQSSSDGRSGNFDDNQEEIRDSSQQCQQLERGHSSVITCKRHHRVNCWECLDGIAPPDKIACNVIHIDGSEVELKCGCKCPVVADACSWKERSRSRMPVAVGRLLDKQVQVLRDTGCSTVVVKRSLVPGDKLTGRTVCCMLIDGTVRKTPVALVEIDTPYFQGQVEAVCMKEPMYDVIVGNIPGVLDKPELNVGFLDSSETIPKGLEDNESELAQAVTTRSQSAKEARPTKPLKVASELIDNISREELSSLQKVDETLKTVWSKVEDKVKDDGVDTVFEVKNDILWRRRNENGKLFRQVVVPEVLRRKVLSMAHDCIMSGHQGVKRTYERVIAHFYWPGIHGDVTRYCRSCDICQRTIAKGRNTKVPLSKMPLIERPFQRVAVDLIGPIAPMTERNNRYILTMVDYATRYPEAVALSKIDAETVAEALVTMFSRVGVPEEILSDQGSQFMSAVMQETSRLLSVRQFATTPYHPMCNGLVERFNGTLKAMLKRMCAEKPKDWDRYLNALLFAYREVPQESLGFSPFELLYGRTVRGPMAILKEIWTGQGTEPEVKLTYQYVLELQERLQETCELARQELQKAQGKQKQYYDVKSKDRKFQPGDKVLLLLPTDGNKLLMHWKGPFEVIERRNDNNYRIQLPGKVKMFHANMLKKYMERKPTIPRDMEVIGAAVVEASNDVIDESFVEFSGHQKETYKDVHVDPDLDPAKKQKVVELLAEFQDVFTDVPKITNLGEHSIKLTSLEPVRSKPYPLPYAMRSAVDKEIDSMLELGIIEPSSAPYASPIVVVKKHDGSNRFCVDYRKLNKITVFDPEPIPQIQDMFSDLAGSQYFSKFDLSKGYWAVPVNLQDRDVTTFVTHRGLYRFKVMPFGLINAPATFSRIMRKLLDKLEQLRNYLDDVLAHTGDWNDHLVVLRNFLLKVRDANLALRPSKCFVGYRELTFLGYLLGANGISPTEDMLDKIKRAPAPTTKKQLRSFLGLVGYYRSFVPNFAAIAVPLTDLTRKGSPNQLVWGDAQHHAFVSLKQYVCNPPILKLPDVSKPFILQTDASCNGIGAILLQEDELIKHPVAFASKKLLPREQNYSTIEREALAIVWGVQKFQNYLYGQHFYLETDHHPLQYLDRSKYQNSRLMRWALILQPYRFTVSAIKGIQNVGADFLSRHTC